MKVVAQQKPLLSGGVLLYASLQALFLTWAAWVHLEGATHSEGFFVMTLFLAISFLPGALYWIATLRRAPENWSRAPLLNRLVLLLGILCAAPGAVLWCFWLVAPLFD